MFTTRKSYDDFDVVVVVVVVVVVHSILLIPLFSNTTFVAVETCFILTQ